jgi:uncharacterized membrane protein YfcA
MESSLILLSCLFFLVALLYACVGHAGASGYLAVMAFMGFSPTTMKPTALALNILVAAIATFKFYRAGAFSKQIFLPLIITSIPCAYIGGLINLPGYIYKPLIGAVLIYAALQSIYTSNKYNLIQVNIIPLPYLLIIGVLLGFLSGVSGVGGGIFLSPLLLFLRAEQPKVISGIAAAFILVNSIAGLLGALSNGASLPNVALYWIIAVIVGGYLGAEMGSKRLKNPIILKLLGVVLITAGIKMFLTI